MPQPKNIATEKQNDKLEHTEGGVTTRDDATDVGVPMLPGDASEPVGPEDAAGAGLKRGDYRERFIPGSTVVPVENPKPGEPTAVVVEQAPRTEQIGDEPGVKGGVGTA
ncbi:MAG: hypothetical protein AVDCRST_MAG68-2061 [uncultured Gemmatimonadetes bacterium]|uniref:Uncharacterized protein n=1 Tax=uncultured Gemmatimonadota bacterium TaxID=203437 RepID=A0A6J4L5G8_9BACT|nr:MAG: hypothetical protein AVDCRST_MAG68-2061 [uncultured Gemmatimonadota bacterium]